MVGTSGRWNKIDRLVILLMSSVLSVVQFSAEEMEQSCSEPRGE